MRSDSAAGADGRHRGTVAFRGARIALRGDAEAPLRWLEEFFAPHAADTQDPPLCEVDLRIDPRRHAAIQDGPGASGQRQIDCFALDGGFAQLALWRDTPALRILYDARAQSFVCIGAGHPIQIVASRDHARVRVLLMRVVRELAMLHALHRGDLLLHGAAAVHRGRTVVIAGQKRAGKTTMLLGLLARSEAQYLSNDRIMVDLSAQPPMAHGVPTIANVRGDSFRYLPDIAAPAPGGRHYLTVAECEGGSPLMEPAKREHPPMSPAQFCRWLDVRPRAAARIGLLVFVRVDPAVERFAVRSLDASESADRIRDSLFSAGPGGLVSEAVGKGWEGAVLGHEGTLDACRRLAQASAACECRIGPLAFQAPDVWDAIGATG